MKSPISLFRLGIMCVAVIVVAGIVKRHARPQERRQPVREDTWSELDMILPRAVRGDHDPLPPTGEQPSPINLRMPTDTVYFAEMPPFVVEGQPDDLELTLEPIEVDLTLPREAMQPELAPVVDPTRSD